MAPSGAPPDPVQLSSLRKPGDQTNWPSGSSGHPSGGVGGNQLPQTDSGRLMLLSGHRDKDRGEVHHCLKAWATPVGGLAEGSGAQQDTAPGLFPWPPRSPTGPRTGNRLGEPKEALSPHSPSDDHTLNHTLAESPH